MYAVFLSKGHLRIIMPLCLAFPPSYTGNPEDVPANMHNAKRTAYNLSTRLSCFEPLSENATYSITVCADVPVDNDPAVIWYKRATGHVFLILEKKAPSKGVVAQVFGYYPLRPMQSLFFNRVRSIVEDNGGREFEASVTKELTAGEFQLVLEKAGQLSRRKYNLNHFNCYDYAVAVFNSIAGIEKLPVSRLRFPAVFGRGGTPCALYRDLKRLQENGSSWTAAIQFGHFKAPSSCCK